MTTQKILKAEFNGQLDLNGLSITCAVLEDGTRVLSERSLAIALGIKGGGAHWQKKKLQNESAVLPEYVSANYLKPFISSEIEEKLMAPIKYLSKAGVESNGALAEILPEVCHIWIKAKEEGALRNETQKQIAERAYTLLRGFAHVGIIALVDEATGYQEVRTRKALQDILEKFIAKELRPWVKTFPDELYENYFRLRGWQYNPKSIKRPGVVGRDTNDFIYDRLAPGVRQELLRLTPKDEKGRLKQHLHRRLTEDIGHPKLREHIASVIALMRAASTWGGFIRLLERSMPKYGETYQILFKEEEE